MIVFPERHHRGRKYYKGHKKELGGNEGLKWNRGGRFGKSGSKLAANVMWIWAAKNAIFDVFSLCSEKRTKGID